MTPSPTPRNTPHSSLEARTEDSQAEGAFCRVGYIYALCEPSGAIRYIGQTIRPSRRLWEHQRSQHWNISSTPKRDWIAQLARNNSVPQMVMLACVPITQITVIEKEFIEKHHGSLLNVAEPGKLTHANKARPTEWAHTHTPLQRLMAMLSDTIRFHEKHGIPADYTKALREKVKSKVSQVRKAEGPAGILRINLEMQRRDDLRRAAAIEKVATNSNSHGARL